MPDPLLPRGALLRLAIILGVAASVLIPQIARANDADGCGDLASTRATVARKRGALTPANAAQAEFLRGALIGARGVAAATLFDGEAWLAPLDDGSMAAVYVVGGEACSLMFFPPDDAAILAAIGRAPTAALGGGL